MTEPLVRTPVGSAKSLQLTPIWEEVVRNQRVPPDITLSEILREIRGRLRAGEWEVRQHALRVLADVLPITGEPFDTADLQAALVANLGSPAPGVRKAAREALSRLLQIVQNSEADILELLGGCNDENVTLGIIIAMPDLLKPFIIPENGGYVLSSNCLTAILTYLVNKVSTPIYRDASVETLVRIRDLCGEAKFQKCLENISPDPKTLQLLALNLDDSGIDLKLPPVDDFRWREYSQQSDDTESNKPDLGWSDNSDAEQIPNSITTYHNYNLLKREGSSEEGGSDGSEDTYTKESAGSVKVVLETDIQLSEERAITMRILEQDSVDTEDGVVFDGPDGRFVSADGSLVMAVIQSSDEEGFRRTPRRVRFGGEVVKLCTPDSDATDVRIEIQEATGHTVERMVIERLAKASQIPLPISPATSRPQASEEGSPRLHKSTSVESLRTNLSSGTLSALSVNISTSAESATETTTTSQTPESDTVNSSPSLPRIEISAPSSSTNSPETPCFSPEASSTPVTNSPDPLPESATCPASSSESSSPPLPSISTNVKDGNTRQNTAITRPAGISGASVIPEFSSDLWSWERLGLLDDENMDILKSNTDWKEELKVLEQLRRNLQTVDAKNTLEVADVGIVRNLVQYLIEYSKPQTAETAFSAVGQILQLIPKTTAQGCLEDVLAGVCRHVSGSSSMSTKMATTEVLRFVFAHFPPTDILDVLLGNRCLHSPSSKMRENALILLLHILMTYPSTMFSTTQLLNESCRSLADSRRRVRHAALEAVAVLAQFIPTQEITACASKFGDSRLVSAVSARMTRRSLPSVSPDGLVLYALQIPSARRLGRPGPPEGADVDWILSGTGSLSTGSAKSRSHLQTSRWVADNNVVRKAARDNPWTAQKHRTEEALAWALVPVPDAPLMSFGLLHNTPPVISVLYNAPPPADSQLVKEDGVFGGAEQNYLGAIRPLYVKLSASEDAVRSQRYAVHRVADGSAKGPPIRVLTPSIFRRQSESKPSPWTENRNREFDAEQRRLERVVGRKSVEAPRPILVAASPTSHASTPPAAVILPSILDKPHTVETQPRPVSNAGPPDRPRFADIKPEVQSQELPNGPSSAPTLSSNRLSGSATTARPPPVEIEQIIPLPAQGDTSDKLFQRTRRESRDLGLEARVSMASAPPAIASREREISSSSSTSNSQPTLPTVEGPLEVLSSISYRSLNDSYNQKVKSKRKPLLSRGGIAGTPSNSGDHFPDTLKPFDRPKDGLDTCFGQLDSQQWEVTMQGLNSLVRLVRHHPQTVVTHLHPLAAALTKQIRNLRSQVARAACQAAGEMLTTLKRNTEQELEEMSAALFHRTADTNRFIRADSNAALDAMADSIAPGKAIALVLTKGASHQNAVVRTTSARLLLRLTEKLGPEKVLQIPKDTRNKMLQAGASLLTEGRLETRSYAKQLYKQWSTHPNFSTIILEAIPANLMRQIDKTLASLRI